MTDDFGYGERISGSEYDRRIVALHSRAAEPDRHEARAIRRKELDLAIDHRLGTDFPGERRDRMWAILEKVERKRLWLGVRYLVRALLSRPRADSATHSAAQAMARGMADELASVLTREEVEAFLGLEPGEQPVLPRQGRGEKHRGR